MSNTRHRATAIIVFNPQSPILMQFPRILMLLACVSLGLVFTQPLWRITLDAPQFPEGLEMQIWVDQISGAHADDKNIIQNINILNHYIGMKYIEPDSIPELQYFPYIIYIMVALGVVFLALNKSWAYLTWFVVLMVLGGLGIYDFYLWLYDYGHNLDPTAPIKIEGMVYMPPLLGEKDLLNFYVTSYPHFGSLFLALSGAFAFLAFLIKRRLKPAVT